MSESQRFLQREALAERRANHDARLRGLRLIARAIFKDRNAQGAPTRDRAAIRAEMRPFLRESLRWLRKARAALKAGDVDGYALLRDRARMYHAFAMLELFQPYANRQGARMLAIASRASDGGKGRAAEIAAAKPKLAELVGVIRGCHERGEPMRPKVWAAEYGISLRTVNRRIAAIRRS